MSLPPLLPWPDIHKRLQELFPVGTPNRDTCVWEIAARTIFVMLYAGAVSGRDSWSRPDQVTRMTDAQAVLDSDAERLAWAKTSMAASKGEMPGRWYAVNTRESIRDDTIRNGLVPNGVIIEKPGVAVTSPAGRYALDADFVDILDPDLDEEAFAEKAEVWRENHLTGPARARIAIVKKGSAKSTTNVAVELPNGESRLLSAGPSSELTKQVIEVFAPRFLKTPAVIFISESGQKVVTRDDQLAKQIGFNIEAEKNLPDVILADVGHPVLGTLIVFVEVVATDGPVSEKRKAALLKVAEKASFSADHIAFVTVFLDRSAAPFKKSVDQLAWGSYAWFASEPDGLLVLTDKLQAL
jgi:hypothetical protein